MRVLFFTGLIILCVHRVGAFDATTSLQEARRLLTGEHKDSDRAKTLLLEVVQAPNSAQNLQSVCWAFLYLGYIEDRADQRDYAIRWYYKAAANCADPTVSDIAAFGIKKPLVWIRHLDSPMARTEQKAAENQQIVAQPNRNGYAYMSKEAPALALANNLTEKERRENLRALWSAIDTNYADFQLKSIDWLEVGRRYLARLDSITNDDDFYLMMFQLVNELKDTHSWLNNYRPPTMIGVGDMPIDLFEDRPFVFAGPMAGWEVLAVDGMPIDEKIESLRSFLKACSSERAFRREAFQFLLAGRLSETVSVKLRSPQGQVEIQTLKRGGRPIPRPALQPSIALTRQRFVSFGRYPTGLGYIQIRSFEGREELTNEFDHALESLRDSVGLILDIRENRGGLNHDDIVGRFLHKDTFVGYSYIKNGTKHKDFEKRKNYIEPKKWEYKQSVALLVSDLTGSAADLFARGMHSAPRTTIIGTTTHGNLSGVAIYAVLPCGLVVRISNGFLTDTKDRAIEGNGNVPDITVGTSIQDYLNGRDAVLERASEVLLSNRQNSEQ